MLNIFICFLIYIEDKMNFLIKKIKKTEKVYDIQVKNTNTFTVGKSKMIVHNCFLNFIEDTAEGLVDNLSETNWLSMLGGGVGVGFGIRSAGDKSTGVMPHLKMYDASSLAYRQGRTRRGSYAAYLDINHPDIINFLEMRKSTGDPNLRTLNLHHGINITDDFMQIIERCTLNPDVDDSWDLVDPHSKELRETVSAKDLWQKILETRMLTGEPYLHFIDTSNKHLPEFQKNLGLSIKQSNLCIAGDSEVTIRLPSGEIIDVQIDSVGVYLNELGQCHIWGRDLVTGIDDFFPLIAWGMTSPEAEVIKITDEDTGYSIICTEDHQIYTTNRGWIKAGELTESDSLKFVGR